MVCCCFVLWKSDYYVNCALLFLHFCALCLWIILCFYPLFIVDFMCFECPLVAVFNVVSSALVQTWCPVQYLVQPRHSILSSIFFCSFFFLFIFFIRTESCICQWCSSVSVIRVFPNYWNMFPETTAHFLKTLNKCFIKTPKISCKTKHCPEIHLLSCLNGLFPSKQHTDII